MAMSFQPQRSQPAHGAHRSTPPHPSAPAPRRPLLQHHGCACGGTCPTCSQRSSATAPRGFAASISAFKVGAAHDPLERQADHAAAAALDHTSAAGASAAPSTATIPAAAAGPRASAAPQPHSPLSGAGEPLPAAIGADMARRFGSDFSDVRIHRDAAAADMARTLHASAFTLGSHVAFAAGRFQPHSGQGRRLLAHELAHVLQQRQAPAPVIRRACDDPDFCTPYATTKEADDAEWWIRNTYMAAEGLATYGSEVEGLYERFLDRSPGDSLDPVVFDNASSYLVSSFRDSGDTTSDVDEVIDMVGNRLHMAPGPLRDDTPTMMSLSNFLSDDELNNRPINYSNPLSVAGHIAGGIGSSAAGDDYRKISQANVWLERVPLVGGSGYVKVSMSPQYTVFDAIDFCPGDCGSPAEQLVTIPMSRLEASGHAYDVPFEVVFRVPERVKRFWF